MGWKRSLIYSGFKLMKMGQDWKMRSTVLTFPSLEISFRKTHGAAVRLPAGTWTK
jgi:hypothetical protein